MKLKDRQTLSRGEVAELLRGLAADIESGAVHLGDQVVMVSERAEAELEFEKKDGKYQLEIEITWR